MYPALVPHIKRLVEQAGIELVFADVGSRNGLRDLADVASSVRAFGFEPNPAEYEKLTSGRTDAELAGWAPETGYAELTYLPYALFDRDGTAPFYVTRGPGAAGLLPPNVERLREIRWKGRTYDVDFAADVFTVERTENVEVRTLASVARDHGIEHIDYLKIDVEGAEYEVLEGAGDLLDRTGVIRVEVCFIPFRSGQRLFSEVDLLLRARHFDLLHYELDPAQIGYKERTTPIAFGPEIALPDRFGQPLSADAVYVNRGLSDPRRAAAQAVVLTDRNYLDEALHVLRTKTSLRDDELFELLRTYRHIRPHHRALAAATGGLTLAGRAKRTAQRLARKRS